MRLRSIAERKRLTSNKKQGLPAMSETHQDIINVTRRLLDSIASGDWKTYSDLSDPSLSCFEPECNGHLVIGMEFHQFYFDNAPEPDRSTPPSAQNTTIASPHVRMLGDDAAVICYVRLVQNMDAKNGASTRECQETRVWQRQNGDWKHVHCHRS